MNHKSWRLGSVGALLAVGLACGGLDPSVLGPGAASEADRDTEVVAEPEPATAAEPTPDPAAGDLASRFGFPAAGGELTEADADHARLLHRSSWDAARVWQPYHDALLDQGWTRWPSNVPPFESFFEKDGELVELKVEQAGTSVMVGLVRKPLPTGPKR